MKGEAPMRISPTKPTTWEDVVRQLAPLNGAVFGVNFGPVLHDDVRRDFMRRIVRPDPFVVVIEPSTQGAGWFLYVRPGIKEELLTTSFGARYAWANSGGSSYLIEFPAYVWWEWPQGGTEWKRVGHTATPASDPWEWQP